jgi:hypothetical protein
MSTAPLHHTLVRRPACAGSTPAVFAVNVVRQRRYLASARLQSLGQPYAYHRTLVETKTERMARGQPVAMSISSSELYQAMGGLTHFSSLAGGPTRMAAVFSVHWKYLYTYYIYIYIYIYIGNVYAFLRRYVRDFQLVV